MSFCLSFSKPLGCQAACIDTLIFRRRPQSQAISSGVVCKATTEMVKEIATEESMEEKEEHLDEGTTQDGDMEDSDAWLTLALFFLPVSGFPSQTFTLALLQHGASESKKIVFLSIKADSQMS